MNNDNIHEKKIYIDKLESEKLNVLKSNETSVNDGKP